MIGQVIARYRILDELGAGGMGVVYRAEDLTLHREVGLKVLPATASPSAVERFLREARAAASLNHPNICTVYDAGEHEGRPYIAMELLKGQTLRTLLLNQRPPLPTVLDMGTQLAEGIAAAHAKGIIHRDIKPTNIWVTEDRVVKILDFGLVKLVPELGGGNPAAADTVWHDRAQLTEHAAVVGTIAYMSPEQARGEVLDTRTDLFSLGVVLYEMYTGRQPFRGATSAVVFNAILSFEPSPFTEMSAITRVAALERIVTKALVKDRGLRFQHASDIASELRAALRRIDTDTGTRVATAPLDEHKHDSSQLDRIVGPLDIPEVLRAYLRRFPDADVQQRRLRHYVWPTIGVEDPITGRELLVTQAEEFVRTTLLSDPEAFVLLLGDYGSGKTSFLQMLGRELATDALMGTPGVLFPIYLSLGFARHTPDLLTAISAHLARHGVLLSPVDVGDFIARQHDVVLLLDGFDEMAGWVDYGAIPEIIEKIRRLQSVAGVRLGTVRAIELLPVGRRSGHRRGQPCCTASTIRRQEHPALREPAGPGAGCPGGHAVGPASGFARHLPESHPPDAVHGLARLGFEGQADTFDAREQRGRHTEHGSERVLGRGPLPAVLYQDAPGQLRHAHEVAAGSAVGLREAGRLALVQ